MRVLKLILEIWYLILPVAVFIGGLIYRKITHQPFKGGVPPVGVLRDLPSSVTGINKQEENADENTQSKGADPDEIEKIGIAGYVLNGTSDVQPAIPFFEKNPE